MSDSTTATKTLTAVCFPALSLISFAQLLLAHVHISNLAAQTGASLFLQTHSAPYHPSLPSPSSGLDWTYNKTEHLTKFPPSLFTHLIAEASEPVPPGWRKVECIQALDGWSMDLMPRVLFDSKMDAAGFGALLRASRQILTIEMNDKLCFLERY